jgi:hypothetical protein
VISSCGVVIPVLIIVEDKTRDSSVFQVPSWKGRKKLTQKVKLNIDSTGWLGITNVKNSFLFEYIYEKEIFYFCKLPQPLPSEAPNAFNLNFETNP